MRKLLKGFLSLGIVGMLFEKLEQNGPRFFRLVLQCVNLRQIQVAPAESGRDPDALFETCHRVVGPLRAQIKNAEIVQSFRVIRTGTQRILQIFVGPRVVAGLGEDHAQIVICIRIIGLQFQGLLKGFASLIPILQMPIRGSQIVESDHVRWIQPERLLKIRYGLGHIPLTCRQKAKVVPGVGQSNWIVGLELNRTFKACSRFAVPSLVQIDAAEAV